MRRENPVRLEPLLSMDFINKKQKMEDLRPVDPNISKADIASLIFILVVLLGYIVFKLYELTVG